MALGFCRRGNSVFAKRVETWMFCEIVTAKKTCVVAYSGQFVGGVIHLPAIVQSEESLGQSFPFFWNLRSRDHRVTYPWSITSSSSSALPLISRSACFLGELDELTPWKLWFVARLRGLTDLLLCP